VSSAPELLTLCAASGVELWEENGRLRYHGAAAAVSAAWAASQNAMAPLKSPMMGAETSAAVGVSMFWFCMMFPFGVWALSSTYAELSASNLGAQNGVFQLRKSGFELDFLRVDGTQSACPIRGAHLG